MILQTALDMHITEQYRQHCDMHDRHGWEGKLTPEGFLSEDYQGEGSQFDIAREVGTRVAAELGELVSWGVFDNCREHGVTVSNAYGWTFCFYEHRNSDDICIEGCPTAEVQSWGPYSDTSKYDVLGQARWMDYDSAAAQMVAILNAATSFDVTRDDLRAAASEAVSSVRS
ncbi:hypothetical protein SEA_ENGINEER_159 [Gordonia Phage Engineer]|nr:hypothetical protein SEA_ENGINEER_159 [Gordonia Phage Engineer]